MKRIVVVDDHPIVRQGFVQLINQEKGLKVVGEAPDAHSGFEKILDLNPDLALIDLSLQGSSGLELIKNINQHLSGIPVLVVSLHDENIYAERVLRAGARGFIMKAEATENMMEAIHTVLKGEIYLSETMRSNMLEKYAGKSYKDTADPLAVLSDREFEVFTLIGRGLRTRVIADTLHLSVKTVETYKAHLKAKLNISDATELVRQAVEWKLKNEENVKTGMI